MLEKFSCLVKTITYYVGDEYHISSEQPGAKSGQSRMSHWLHRH